MPDRRSVVIAGDLFPNNENMPFFCKGDIESLFGKEIIRVFEEADLRMCNLEGALTDHKEICRKTGPVKLASSSAVAAFRNLGIDCCLLANNHVTDGGHRGVLDTMETLDRAGIHHIGAGANESAIEHFFMQEVCGIRIGVYNVSETMYNKPTANRAGVWLYDELIVCQELGKLKGTCDYLIVIYHGGIEKFRYPSPELRKRFHRMADSGADLVVAQHTHCIGCEEIWNGAYLLYGQGDFLLNNFAPGLTDTGLLLELEILGGKVSVKKHPVRLLDNCFVRMDPKSDLTSFRDRSEKLDDEVALQRELVAFCDRELPLYLAAYKSPSHLRRRLGRLFPVQYHKWLYRYNERDLLFVLHTLRSEQNRETAIVGLEHLLNL